MRIRIGPVASFLVVTLLIACSPASTPSTPTPSATTTPMATTTIAVPTPTAPPISIASGPIPPVIGQLIEAVVAKQAAPLAALATYLQVGCTKALGVGGPPKCKGADVTGSVYKVFAAGRCEPEWVEDAGLTIAQIVTSAGPLYAAATIAPAGPTPDTSWPKGDSVVLFRGVGPGAPASYFILNAGRIVQAHFVCDTGSGGEDRELRRLGATSYYVAPSVR
ncbi:MAG: hypothetical protein DWI58_01360 [Chloroflexi bacterium]|nr:MAG: hypothetical protein DWI58_01360 [Chloroflexota bacterium]